MNGQEPQKLNWKQIKERTDVALNNLKIELEIQKSILKEAEAHLRGQENQNS